MIMPEEAGRFKAMWALMRASVPEFGEILHAEFEVDDFPFMEWMAGETETEEQPVPQNLSMAVAMQNHLLPSHGEVKYDKDDETEGVVSLGHVSGLHAGDR